MIMMMVGTIHTHSHNNTHTHALLLYSYNNTHIYTCNTTNSLSNFPPLILVIDGEATDDLSMRQLIGIIVGVAIVVVILGLCCILLLCTILSRGII